MSASVSLTVRQTDALADRVLDRCRTGGVVDAEAPAPSWARFHAQRELLQRTFDVPTTTLTPLAARVLYGLAAMCRPRSVVVLGCYVGNLMAWVSGPGLGPGEDGSGRRALGLDVDTDAVAQASANFAAADFAAGLRVVAGDAFDAEKYAAGTAWDLLLIDIDVPGARKSGYPRLLERWLPYRAPGAVVVAHDICHPVFRWDLAPYRDFVRDRGASATMTLPVDECGLEVSRWPG
jgi:predicted O-methyltransferase YrrM